MPRFRDYYDDLEVAPDASPDEIHHAYKELARVLHPDALAGKSEAIRKRAERKFKQINEAYECLRDPARRTEYDVIWLAFHRLSSELNEPIETTSSEDLPAWTCSDCGAKNSRVRAFCRDCGYSRDEVLAGEARASRVAALREERKLAYDQGYEVCPSCGRFRNAIDARFCGGCGEDVLDFWTEGPYSEDSGRGIAATYGLDADEVFQAVIDTFFDRQDEMESLSRTLLVYVPTGIFDRRMVEIRVADRPDTGCDLMISRARDERRPLDPDLYETALMQVHETLRQDRFG